MDAFRSGMLLLALGAFSSSLSAAPQSPAAATKDAPAAQQQAAPPAGVSPPDIVLPALQPAAESSPQPSAKDAEKAAAPQPAPDPPPDDARLPDIHALNPAVLPAANIHQPGPKSVRKGVNFWSPEQEITMGKQIDGQMLAQVQLLDDPVVTGYLEDVVSRIARSSDVDVPVVLRVVASSQPDSFSLPGGYVYITVGMVRETRSEAELAAILSHEVAHIACRHATRQMTKRQMLNFVAIPLMFVGGPIGFAIGEGFSLAYPLAVLKFSRNAETEADAIGLRYMSESGYDPAAAVSLFERLASADTTRMPGLRRLFSTHPITHDRMAAALKTIDTLPARDEYVVDTSRYDEALTRLGRLGFNRDPGVPSLIRRTEHPEPGP